MVGMRFPQKEVCSHTLSAICGIKGHLLTRRDLRRCRLFHLRVHLSLGVDIICGKGLKNIVRDRLIFPAIAGRNRYKRFHCGRRREVSLRIFVLILGVFMLLGGVAMLACPAAMRESVTSFFLGRPHSSRLTMTMVSGLVWAIAGALLIFSASKNERCSVYR
jgi:hypothetical protein